MTDNNNKAIESVARSVVDDAEHYVAAVSAMADRSEMSADEDIVSTTGIKLVARGTRIDARLREKLSGHHVSGMNLEKCLSVAGAVTSDSLAADTGRLIDEDAWLKRLVTRSGDSRAISYDVSRLKLPRQILFRLSVTRDQYPVLYRHSLSVAVISHYLGLRLKSKQPAIDNLLIAALCHDLGELYIPPAILESGHRVTDEERRYIYVHPIAGWLMVRELAGVDSEVASAIIQHQERLDGSGYPYAKRGNEIGLSGRILAAADVTASIMRRFSDHRRLSTLFRLNNFKYDPKVVDLLHEAIVQETPAIAELERDAIGRRLTGFASVLDGWARLRAATEITQSAPGEFLSERMFNLRTVVVQFGFDPDSIDVPLKLAEEDATIAAELTAVVDELQFQLADLGHEFDRRSPGWLSTLDPQVAVALGDWRLRLQDCIDS